MALAWRLEFRDSLCTDMALEAGTRVGPYEIVGRLGSGGMGAVYRARDLRLGRDVAIKVVSDALQSRPDLRERFKVEATAIAALNHPQICQVYDVGEHDRNDYLVMELVEGESLAARLQHGKLPIDQALKVAREIAAALDAAHRRGIVHRDVKPSNVMLTRSGAKLLDFGLARLRPADVSALAGESTIAAAGNPITSTGMMLGTWQYMAPEQVRGQSVDSRTDVFALGALIYEITTGRPAFSGATHRELTAAILDSEPPSMASIDARVPAALDRIVLTCLAKAPEDRWQSAGDVGRALDTIDLSPRNSADTARSISRRVVLPLAAAAALAVAGVAAIAWSWLPGPEAATSGVVRSTVLLGDIIVSTDDQLAFADDGRSVVFAGNRSGSGWKFYRHELATGVTTPIAGTEDGAMPFLSPDGQWLGFKGNTHLMKVPVGGGRPTALAPIRFPQGGSWGDDGTIVFGDQPESGLRRVSSSGGVSEQLTTILDDERGNDHRYPQVLPGSRVMLFAVGTGPEDFSHIVALDLRTGTRKTIVEGSFAFKYVSTGYLAYTHEGVLSAMPFDADRLETTGPPLQIADNIDDFDGAPTFDFSATGDLVFVPAPVRGPQQRLAFVDLGGRVEIIEAVAPGPLVGPRFSPEGDRVAFQRNAAKNNAWVYDIKRATVTRVTYGRYHGPVWTPDGRLTLATGGPGNTRLVIRSADGSGTDEPLTSGESNDWPRSWTPDGRTLVFERYTDQNLTDIMAVSLPSRTVTPILNAAFVEYQPRLSPDGRWLAYVSKEDGSAGQLYIRPMTGGGRRVQVSTNTANLGVWSPDGRRIYYRGPGPPGTPVGIWAADVTTAPILSVSKPRLLFANEEFTNSFDVSPDGTRFVMVTRDSRPPTKQLELVLNVLRRPPGAAR